MSNFLTMIERIEDEIDDGGIRTQVQRAIQSAITHHSRKRFFFNQVQFTFPIVADDEYFDETDNAEIPNILAIDSFYVTDSGGVRHALQPKTNWEVQDAQNGLVRYRPDVWAYVRKQIRIFPIADASYTAVVEAWSRLSAISADTDTNAWMTDGEELIRQRAKRILYMDVIKEPTDAQACQALEEMALDGLLLETELRTGNQLLSVDPALLASAGFDIRNGT